MNLRIVFLAIGLFVSIGYAAFSDHQHKKEMESLRERSNILKSIINASCLTRQDTENLKNRLNFDVDNGSTWKINLKHPYPYSKDGGSIKILLPEDVGCTEVM